MVEILAVSMEIGCDDICAIMLCEKWAHFRVTLYSGQPKTPDTAIIVLSDQHFVVLHLWGGWIISVREKCSITQNQRFWTPYMREIVGFQGSGSFVACFFLQGARRSRSSPTAGVQADAPADSLPSTVPFRDRAPVWQRWSVFVLVTEPWRLLIGLKAIPWLSLFITRTRSPRLPADANRSQN